jgi:hypothetical protein
MKYCDGEKCKGSVPAWPVHLTSPTGFLRQINGVPLDVIPNRHPIDEVIEVFERWLILKDPMPVYAVLGAVTANLLPGGDPVWLGIIGPPSSGKTEILISLSRLPYVVQASSLSPASFLSATPKKDQDKEATGGLLPQIGAFGIIVLKDFTTMLSLRPEVNAEVFAVLREVFDGRYTRHVATDGGRTLSWKGKAGLVFAATNDFDRHHAVIRAMGDRYLLIRLSPVEGQYKRAHEHTGEATQQMRNELAGAVARLCEAVKNNKPRRLSLEEKERIGRLVELAVLLRATVDRDRYTREIEVVHGAEGTARLFLCLERLLAGLDMLGVDRETALMVVKSVAMDSVPPIRRRAYEYLTEVAPRQMETAEVAERLRLPNNTVRRHLEDLAAYGLIKRITGEKGEEDHWQALV